MFLINGLEQDSLPASDRATQFGDGCFSTARILDGAVCLLDAHILRLQTACETLLIPFTQWETLRHEMRLMAAEKRVGVLKVIISRGSGGRGYSGADCEHPTRILSVSAYPAHYARWRTEGVALSLSPVRLGRNPVLAGIKHLNRLEQVLIRTHLEQTDADEALVLDSEGFITECCAANLLWRKGRDVFTPSLEQAGVKGIMRQFCLQQLARSGFRVVEVSEREDALLTADEVVICNALMPVLPVRAYGQQRWSSRELFQFLAPICEQTRSS
ncbi:aminodeoxychorismate lyase [Enterobacter huaxiensis]|jgi:4-amino-4-deoxychorismate lyase|uniref:aminodeoxychorismate lyase n=1 Tax=Enterobacter huaxiensis TaxID=2494702 RepID=UPI0021758E0D|nr:aminodeoxychorismate lyase [Enterobacter huaxiensis]MCS5448387.1 aminodeoxychorismate lyase [Enterobacter huaxiensis]